MNNFKLSGAKSVDSNEMALPFPQASILPTKKNETNNLLDSVGNETTNTDNVPSETIENKFDTLSEKKVDSDDLGFGFIKISGEPRHGDEYVNKIIVDMKKNNEKQMNEWILQSLGKLDLYNDYSSSFIDKKRNLGDIKLLINEYDLLFNKTFVVESKHIRKMWNKNINTLISNYSNISWILKNLRTKAVSVNVNVSKYSGLINYDGISIAKFQLFHGGVVGFLRLLKDKSITISDITNDSFEMINNILNSEIYNTFPESMGDDFIENYNSMIDESAEIFSQEYELYLSPELSAHKCYKLFVTKRFVFCDLKKLLIVLSYEEVNHVIELHNKIHSQLNKIRLESKLMMGSNVVENAITTNNYMIVVDILYILKVCKNGSNNSELGYANKLVFLLDCKNVGSIIKSYQRCFETKKNK